MSHRYHGPEEAELVLKDDCERCAEHAEEPWNTVDHDRLVVLVCIAMRWEYGAPRCDAAGIPVAPDQPRTVNEQRACQNILDRVNAVAGIFGRSDYVKWVAAQLV